MCSICVTLPNKSDTVVDAPDSRNWTRKFVVLPVFVVNAEGVPIKVYFDWIEVLRFGPWDAFHQYRRLPGNKKAYHTFEVGW